LSCASEIAVRLCERRAGVTRAASFPPIDDLAGIAFELPSTEADWPHAVVANACDNDVFVFVDDKQGPFIPRGGAARIQLPPPGAAVRVTVEGGDAVLAYRGA